MNQTHAAPNINDKDKDEDWFQEIKKQTTENINNFLFFCSRSAYNRS